MHARNTSEAFDSSVPVYIDNAMDIECDFIVNEEHAKAVAIRELIYSAREANKWSVTMVDDPRIEYGDILQFHDGSQLYVEDFSRSLERGSEATLDVSGFLIPVAKVVSEGLESPESPDGGGSPGEGSPGEGSPPGGSPPESPPIIPPVESPILPPPPPIPPPKKFIWAWTDYGGPEPDAPGEGGPSGMGGWESYFFGLIGKTKGTPANDYQDVLGVLLSAGMRTNAVPGGEEQRPQESWPFYGMLMVVSGGTARGRVQLPTNEPDGNGYWTRLVQVIADDPNP